MEQKIKAAAFFSGKIAEEYDKRAKENLPILEGMYFTIHLALKELPDNAQILSVGTGTGNEIFFMAERFANWHFTCVEPSEAMAEILKEKVKAANLENRVTILQGFLEDFSLDIEFDCALCLLVSHFIIKPKQRNQFFQRIFAALKDNAIFVNTEISSDMKSEEFKSLLPVWINLQKRAGLNDELVKEHIIESMGKSYIVSSNSKIAKILETSGFISSALLYRSIFINTWISRKKV